MTPPPGASADRDPDARAYPERMGTPPQQASHLSPDRSGPAIPAPASRTRTRLRRFVHEVTYQHGIHPALVPGVSIEDQQVRYRVDKVVLLVVGALVLGFVAWSVTRPDDVLAVSSAALSWVMANLGWLFSLLAIGMVVFLLAIAFSRYGDITLGLDGEKPEYSTPPGPSCSSPRTSASASSYSTPTSRSPTTSPRGPAPTRPPATRPSPGPWPRPPCTGASTRGRSTPWWASRWRTCPTDADVCRS